GVRLARFGLAVGFDGKGNQRLARDDLADRGLEARVEQRRHVELAGLEHRQQAPADLVGLLEARARPGDVLERIYDARAELAAQLVAALAADAEDLDLLAVGQLPLDEAPRLADDRRVEGAA